MFKTVDAIEVRIWEKTVGALALDPRLGYYAFEYDPKFVRTGIDLAPLSMPLSQADWPFIFTDLPELTFRQLPAMLADALPDDFGNALIDAWMATKGLSKERITPLDRLAYIGKRGMGALEFKPARTPTPSKATALALGKLVEGARKAVHGELGEDHLADSALAQIIQVGTSAGGARAKAVVAWNPETNVIRAGQFDIEPGFEHWILKFDGMGRDSELGGSQDYGRIEYAYYLMAKAAGIAIKPSRLLEENGRAHFMTMRFDREGNRKHHTQTLCAMAHLDYKQKATHDYGQFLKTVEDLGLGYETLKEAFRRVVFNVLAVNHDDHTKNISFLLREGGNWELAPAYDLTHAYNPSGKWTYQHLMSVNGKFAGIGKADLLTLSDRFGLGHSEKIIGEVRSAVSAWPDFAIEAGLGVSEVERIAAQTKRIDGEVFSKPSL